MPATESFMSNVQEHGKSCSKRNLGKTNVPMHFEDLELEKTQE